jgi:hypothetical protein
LRASQNAQQKGKDDRNKQDVNDRQKVKPLEEKCQLVDEVTHGCDSYF